MATGRPRGPLPRDVMLRYAACKHRAKRFNRPFALTPEQFAAYQGQPCHYCGGAAAGGVDRKDNREGYTPENTVPACGLCNLWKSTLTLPEFTEHLARVYRQSVLGLTDDGQYAPPPVHRQWQELGERRTSRPPGRPRSVSAA